MLVAAVISLTAVERVVTAYPVASAIVGAGIAGALGYVLPARWRLRQLAWQVKIAQTREIDRYHAMSPGELEEALALLCTRDGCTDVEVTGKAGDLGADVTARSPDGVKIVLQAKRYATTNKVTSRNCSASAAPASPFTTHASSPFRPPRRSPKPPTATPGTPGSGCSTPSLSLPGRAAPGRRPGKRPRWV
ncbi:restriction endonuclease [Amycolatopsis sp. NBC_00355]